jgi:hypothetical protein
MNGVVMDGNLVVLRAVGDMSSGDLSNAVAHRTRRDRMCRCFARRRRTLP